jgi:hypothetical protein
MHYTRYDRPITENVKRYLSEKPKNSGRFKTIPADAEKERTQPLQNCFGLPYLVLSKAMVAEDQQKWHGFPIRKTSLFGGYIVSQTKKKVAQPPTLWKSF